MSPAEPPTLESLPARPAVSVVVPFAGEGAAAAAALALLDGLDVEAGDERILADNCGIVTEAPAGVRVIAAAGERSPAHARNVGARAAHNDWILFLDADTRPPADLLARFFAAPIPSRIGAVAGELAGVVTVDTLAARYGAHANFLSQRAHLSHYYRPRAASANLLVRRRAFLTVGGFCEGVRAAEDTDFCWRLQEAGWTLGYCPGAVVGHRYRERLSDLRRQWRAYAAGSAWLETRWPGYHPDPALHRLVRLVRSRLRGGPGLPDRPHRASGPTARLPWADRLAFLAVQCLLGVEEQIGLRQSNRVRPVRSGIARRLRPADLRADRRP
ncbi:glycosyltransferase family 2 protein [Conexibacter sp. DBS9H8]|uniref:glycosyltransferase family 2 protein n=1 Tax=Conexibacter sp. DBS9H8 TaxID=2937801 RepID=UPI00200E7635|nr:glycosyltransferase family 2 protein [Conexibacter sp. DBS9H8]